MAAERSRLVPPVPRGNSLPRPVSRREAAASTRRGLQPTNQIDALINQIGIRTDAPPRRRLAKRRQLLRRGRRLVAAAREASRSCSMRA